ncbi:ABC transporter ATP-binding protein [Pseudoalteromonas denitrificans]|uniref:Iron(III) transport system ATP-binding protein n=1 Tax=Pseudoalteromonas denitrificans DSM 6059 TaxID=1123010 RepID=A0A1I1JHI5_9GAMM|nr:ABC transporter ATP-binding protein [Pseudoalteromonas denitrificans]SFC46078.1 iron(III) transport system ATP-binding protein [Pseudoalteromonas denitrificans DSM 6059]
MSDLLIEHLNFDYQGNKVIDNLSLMIEKNEIVCLLGASGCGKTTTLKAIAGLIKPSEGFIKISNKTVNDKNVFIAPEVRNIGMMFQDYALFPHLTVAQNIGYGLLSRDKTFKRDRISEMLHLVKLEDLGERYPHQLSGGQQQRVAIARALAYKPSLLLLDEPFSNIDHQVRFQLIEDIRRIIKDQQVSAIFVTHSKDEAFAFSDKLAIMHQGEIIQQDTAKMLFHQPKAKMVAEFLGQGIYLDAQYQGGQCFKTSLGDVISTQAVDENKQKGSLYVRPQYLSLQAKSTESSGIDDVTILSKRFMGTRYIYRLKVSAQEIEVVATDDGLFNTGDRVDLNILPHPVNFFIN